ncbi:putative GABA permease [Mytilinidion resinicola]|uniref:GABA permease n=1 Tax=Mytilinidion resinicola TaxID=574789 RepID=A0A6A6Y641_9PEZI|nr:putative GABA permease [Mytilinidion resinicola]KAF2804150.1 putative GABA permease [Mytilinidion resinicola]
MAGSMQLRSLDDKGVAVAEHPAEPSRQEKDNQDLARLGKKPVLKRNFGFVSMLAFACTVMITWEGVLLLFSISFNNGGYAGSVYEYMLVWAGTATTFATMGELASMAPTAGGQYHWVSMLAPKSSRKILSYLVGWLTVTGWQAIVASGCFLCATLIEGLIIMNDGDYAPKAWQTMLFYWATIVFAISVNTVISRLLPNIESLILILHTFGFFAILIPLVYFGPHGHAKLVFTSFYNGGKWPTQGLSFMVGTVGQTFNLLGADSAVHMSEEIHNPALNVPRAMVFSVLLNGTLGLGMLIAALFCLGNADEVLTSPYGYPFMAIFKQAVGSLPGALTMAALITTLNICATISFVATASRMTWAFARDRGTPGWATLSKIEPRTTLPLVSIALTMITAILLSLIGLGSAVAFNDVVSLAINGLYTSYLLGNSLLLYRRLTGGVRPYSASDTTLRNTIDSDHLVWGPWKIPEPLGTIVNAFGCIYLFVMLVFSFWPTQANPTPDLMNYSSLMVGAVLIFGVVYYLVWGNRSYTGPVVEVDASK